MRRTRMVLLCLVAAAMAASESGTRNPIPEARYPSPDRTANAKQMLRMIDAYHAKTKMSGLRPLRVIYLCRSDRKPFPDYAGRIGRAAEDIQDFYRKGMQANGFGPRTFELERDASGMVIVHFIQGKMKPEDYHYSKGGDPTWNEAKAAMAKEGMDISKETILLVTANADEVNGKLSLNAPFFGSGGIKGGTGWVGDASCVDPRNYRSTATINDGARDRTVGKFNSVWIGGFAHELGHGFGLPHDMETDAERAALGTALMGSGNYTYRDELRGEDKGSFLTFASALRLASHPCFTHSERGVNAKPESHYDELDLAVDAKDVVVTGRLRADPPAYAAIVYNDMAGRADYDAVPWTSVVDGKGRFKVTIGEIKPGTGELRLAACLVNGAVVARSFAYSTDADGTIHLDFAKRCVLFRDAFDALIKHDFRKVRSEAERIRKTGGDEEVRRWCAQLDKLCERGRRDTPAEVPDATKRVWLSDLRWSFADVGWLEPGRNCIPADDSSLMPFLVVDGRLYETGLYAAATSHYRFDLGGKWQKLMASFGFAPASGSSVWVVRGDGKELFRSPVIRDMKAHSLEVDVTGVKTLELVVEDGGDGNYFDWAVWLAPELLR